MCLYRAASSLDLELNKIIKVCLRYLYINFDQNRTIFADVSDCFYGELSGLR